MTGSVVSPELRQRVRDLATPIARGLGRLGLTPNALTLIGFLGTCIAAIAAASQAWLVAGILVLVFGIFDLFDGALARATGRATRFGAFLDSTFDRAGEAIVYVGIAAGSLAVGFWFGALLSMIAMAAAFMVSYVRAKAEGLGFAPGSGMAAVGLAPREVRTAILTLGLVAAGLIGPIANTAINDCRAYASGLLGPMTPSEAASACPFLVWNGSALALGLSLGLITVLATITTIQRILHVRAQSREG